jgi:lipopolysaccharide heptosyltransferase II
MDYYLKLLLKEIYLWIRRRLLRLFIFWHRTSVPSPDKIRHILYLRHDRIGDMVQSTAALKALRRGYPHARITVLASERNSAVLQHNPSVDEILIYKGLRQFIRETRPRNYDLIIDPFLTHELRQALMTYLAAGRYRIGFEVAGREAFFNLKGPRPLRPRRMVDHLLELIENVGVNTDGCVPEVFVTERERQRAAKSLAYSKGGGQEKGFIVALHPGAYYPSQRWPAPRFGALARMIVEQSKSRVILLGSPEEESLVEEVKKNAGEGAEVFPGLTLSGLIALLSQSDLFVGNNSGPLHIASALKVPTVSFVGPTVTPLWLPYGENNVVINKAPACSPCNKAICKGHECMESITVEEVYKAVENQIAAMGTKRKYRFTAQRSGQERKKS